MNILELNNLCAFYGRAQALRDVELAIPNGGITALLGANGAGKTTTLRAISGLVRSTGSIKLLGQEIGNCKTERIARLGVAHVPEDRGTFLSLSVRENLAISSMTRKDRIQVSTDLDLIFTYFPRLKERIRQKAGLLSGGEQQMLAIGRALMIKPRLILLDEPSFGLAPLVTQEIFRNLRAINRESRIAMLLVEQNAPLALELADNAFVLESGAVGLSGSASVVARDERVRKSYLGI